jgi:hypothetical protein
MEVYPFHHKNLFFNVITDYDLTFTEVRNILDQLLQKKAFDGKGENWGCGNLYLLHADNIEYEVDVNCYEVFIYRRTELTP